MTFEIAKLRPYYKDSRPLTKWTCIFLILFGTFYFLLEPTGIGIIKVSLMAIMVIMLLVKVPYLTKASLCAIAYLGYQFLQATFFPESWRWATLLYSAALVLTYTCYYNMVYVKKVFTINQFIRLLKWLMMAYFVFCELQQFCIIVGITYAPIINYFAFLDRGLGCNSLSYEPSSFARTMLVCYYAYVKCCEYKRGEGPFSLRELFSRPYKWVTIRFLWMMLTMGSATAFVCLLLFSLYFVRKNNWFYLIPSFLAIYIFVLPLFNYEQLNRAVNVGNAVVTVDNQTVRDVDGSAATRISPIINSINADFTNSDTWFGHGIDYAINNNLINTQRATLFDDYGLILYLIAMVMNFTCAYSFWSLGALFMFFGVGGGAGTNIQYSWFLMMLMTAERYFHDIYYGNIDEEDVQ